MRFIQNYNRAAAVMYAHKWAYGRNPRFYDYENLGGDCTNFASQCIYAGSGVMNFTPEIGWYYIDANQKAPAWTGVPYLYNFLTRRGPSVGPVGEPCEMEELCPGDLIQLSFKGEEFQHSPIVVSVGEHPNPKTFSSPPTATMPITVRWSPTNTGTSVCCTSPVLSGRKIICEIL